MSRSAWSHHPALSNSASQSLERKLHVYSMSYGIQGFRSLIGQMLLETLIMFALQLNTRESFMLLGFGQVQLLKTDSRMANRC